MDLRLLLCLIFEHKYCLIFWFLFLLNRGQHQGEKKKKKKLQQTSSCFTCSPSHAIILSSISIWAFWFLILLGFSQFFYDLTTWSFTVLSPKPFGYRLKTAQLPGTTPNRQPERGRGLNIIITDLISYFLNNWLINKKGNILLIANLFILLLNSKLRVIH